MSTHAQNKTRPVFSLASLGRHAVCMGCGLFVGVASLEKSGVFVASQYAANDVAGVKRTFYTRAVIRMGYPPVAGDSHCVVVSAAKQKNRHRRTLSGKSDRAVSLYFLLAACQCWQHHSILATERFRHFSKPLGSSSGLGAFFAPFDRQEACHA